jgi:hypothetical protein
MTAKGKGNSRSFGKEPLRISPAGSDARKAAQDFRFDAYRPIRQLL